MTARSDRGTTLAAAADRTRDFWAYYRRYTDTAIHAATTAALTAFGLLIFIDPSFAWLAIASYVLPPAVLYAVGSDVGEPTPDDVERSDEANRPAERRTTVVDGGSDFDDEGADANADVDAGAGGVDRDVDGPDHDHDGPDRDADGIDLDRDGPDHDADGADADGPDRDADGADLDFDSDGLDTDVDFDGPDIDRDG
jgi:hypothetical protein